MAKGERLSIKPPEEAIGSTDKVSNEAIVSDAKTGAGAGALTGAAWGLSCGFFAIICSPIGALAGAMAGGSAGAVVGSTRGLTDDQVEQLKVNIAHYLQSNDPAQSMNHSLINRASREWTLVDRSDDVKELSIDFDQLGLKSLGDGKMSLTMSLVAEISYLNSSGKRFSRRAAFSYDSPPSPVESWTGSDNEFIAQRFQDGYLILSENVVMAVMKISG